MGTGQRQSRRLSRNRAIRASQRQPAADSVERFGELFEQANDIVILNDVEGRIVAANRLAREFGGYDADDVRRGVSLREVLPPADYEAAMLLTQRAFDGEPIPEVYEREAVLRDGARRVLELRSNVLRRAGQPPLLQTIGRDVTEKREGAAFQSSLLQVSQALLTAQRLDELGQIICEEARRVLRVDGVYLWLRRGDELVGYAAAGRMAAGFTEVRRPLNDSLIGEMYRASDVLVVNDFAHSLYAQEHAMSIEVRAMLAVPLRHTGAPVGVLVFTDHSNPRRFTMALRTRAMIFGAQTTVAIESALARDREEEEGRVSSALLRVTRAIRELLDAGDVLREIGRNAREVLQCDWTAVCLYDPASGVLRVAASEGFAPDVADELRVLDFRLEGGELGALLEHKSVELTEPTGTAAPLYQRWRISSMLAVPMLRAHRLSGAIVVGFSERRGAFSAREQRIAEGIAAQAAAAVDNARLVEDLRHANALKSEFLGTMSHELRTPLNAILGYAQLLRDGIMGALEAEQTDALERIVVNGYGLLDLINTTLDVSRLEAGRVTMHVCDFPLDELLDELRNEFSLRGRTEVTLLWPERVDLPLRTDHGKLKAVLRNLVDNALKFTPHGSVTVNARAAHEQERVWLSVRDSGIGIPPHAMTSIFEMFQQVDGTQSASRSGVGLGLYVVRRYAELLGGAVTVDSTPGHGSTFTIDIPRSLSAGA
jgi:PAS domain S-box-containing protein